MKDVMLETKRLVEEPEKRELTKFEMSAMKLLLANMSLKEICVKLKCGRTKLWLTTRDDFFRQELQSNQETIFNAALSVLVSETRSMARILVGIAENESETASNRIQAIKLAYRSVLDMGSQFEIRNRLSALESQLSDM